MPGRKSHRGGGESRAVLKQGSFSVPWTERPEARFGALQLPGGAADPPRKAWRPWVTPTELTALHPWPAVGAGLTAARSGEKGLCTALYLSQLFT